MSSHRRFTDQGDTTVTTSDAFARQRVELQMQHLQFSELLTSKIDLELLLEAFFIESAGFVRFEGMSYRLPESSHVISYGNRRQHSHRIDLELGEQPLGELTLLSATPFSYRTVRELEQLARSLVYPLRDALDYRDALHRSWVDAATGMYNRVAFDAQLPREIVHCRQIEMPMSLLLIDLDHFDKFNEGHGWAVGDALLERVADTLTRNLRVGDTIFRTDTDAFAIFLNNTDFDGAEMVAERLRRTIDRCFQYENVQVVQSASAGVTEMSEDDTPETIVQRAEAALMNAKRAGRNRLRAIPGMASAT